MTAYDDIRATLRQTPRRWLVTGVAGFIGSNLLEALLVLGQQVVGLDNLATGFQRNLDEVRAAVGEEQWSRFTFIEGDIRDLEDCRLACGNIDFVLHQAAVGSVPRSIADPLTAHAANATGFLNMLVAARDAGVSRFVFASSSSLYGDSPLLPKVEGQEGRLLSPYAVTKRTNELYADVFARTYGLPYIGLRYFNVFGRRQDPQGAYAAVIPAWFANLMKRRPVTINGDGETTRDFCYVANAVQANILAATVDDAAALNQIYNVAVGERITLLELARLIREMVAADHPEVGQIEPVFLPFREGDVRHSLADIGKARRLLAYAPTHRLRDGLTECAGWYRQHVRRSPA